MEANAILEGHFTQENTLLGKRKEIRGNKNACKKCKVGGVYDLLGEIELPSTDHRVFSLLKECKEENIILSTWAEDILNQSAFLESHKLLKLSVVRTTPRRMGLSGYHKRDPIYERARTLGLSLCPQETAIRVVNQIPEKLNEGATYVGMNSMQDSSGSKAILMIEPNDDFIGIGAEYTLPFIEHSPDSQWLFCLNRE